jgi:putative peptidoglycan lipid II flippase
VEHDKKLQELYHDSIRLITFVIGFASVGIILFSTEIVSLAFQRGEFNAVSLKLTSEPLKYYAVGALFFSIYIFQMRFYYARRILLKLGMILLSALVIKIILSLLLVGPMKHNGLALATVLSWIWGFTVITIDLKRFFKMQWSGLLSKTAFKILLNILIVTLFWGVIKSAWPYDAGMSFIESLSRFIVLGISGLGIYIGLAFLLRLPEPLKVYNAIMKRVQRGGNSNL